MAKSIVASSATKKPRKSATEKKPAYCLGCNENGIFCTCKPQIGDITTKLEVKRIKRGTFLFSFVGGAA
jgi:hypothetical protein